MSNIQKDLIENASYSWTEDSTRKIITTSNPAKSAFFFVQEIGSFKTFYPYFTERKNLNSFLIIFTLSGTGHLDYCGEQYALLPGSCVFLDCMEYHRYYVSHKETWNFLWVHFNGSNTRGYYDLFSKERIYLSEIKNPDLFQATFESLLEIWDKKNRTTEVFASKLITDLLTTLLMQDDTQSQEEIYLPDYIRSIAKDISHHYQDTLSLEYFEKKYNRSRFTIEKEFKKYIGVTVTESIIQARISHAKELLKYSELSISEIAFETGMNHVSHFINLFKAREHFTPKAYRREWRNE